MHLGSWSDGEIYRAIAEGVNREGRPMFPMMPFLAIGKLDKEDVLSIIAYLRSLRPAGAEQPANSLSFPFNLIARTIPVPAQHVTSTWWRVTWRLIGVNWFRVTRWSGASTSWAQALLVSRRVHGSA